MNPTDREIYKYGTPEERVNLRDDAIDEIADRVFGEFFSYPYRYTPELFELAYKIAEREFDELEESYRHDVPY